MITILVTNRKGGVGKTTTTINLASWLGVLDKKVLVLDLDTQSHVQYGFGYKKAFKSGSHKAMLSGDILPAIIETEYKNVSFVPANINFDIQKLKKKSYLQELYLKNDLDDLFDICIIDTPPTSGILLDNALKVSDYTLIPMQTEYLGLVGVIQFLKIFYSTASSLNPNFKLLGIIPTMYNKSMKEHKNIIKGLEKAVGKERILNPIRKDFKLSNAFLAGKPIAYIDRRCRGTRDYKKLAIDILEKLKG